MIGCLRTCVRKQPIISLYFEFENELKFYNLWAWSEVPKKGFSRNKAAHLKKYILYVKILCYLYFPCGRQCIPRKAVA